MGIARLGLIGFLGGALNSNGGAFAPGGALAHQVTAPQGSVCQAGLVLVCHRFRPQPMDSLAQFIQLHCLHGTDFLHPAQFAEDEF